MKIRNITIVPLFFLIVSLVPLVAAGAVEKIVEIKVAFDQWPPFTDENDPDMGICMSITTAAFKSSKYKVVPKIIPAKRIFHTLQKGDLQIDASPYWWHSEERAKVLFFSKPLLHNTVHFFVKSDSNITYDKLEDLKGITIGVISGY